MHTNLYPLSLLLFLLAVIFPYGARGQDGISYENAFPNLTFEFPVEIQAAGDGSDRLFVVEQPGRIRVSTWAMARSRGGLLQVRQRRAWRNQCPSYSGGMGTSLSARNSRSASQIGQYPVVSNSVG